MGNQYSDQEKRDSYAQKNISQNRILEYRIQENITGFTKPNRSVFLIQQIKFLYNRKFLWYLLVSARQTKQFSVFVPFISSVYLTNNTPTVRIEFFVYIFV